MELTTEYLTEAVELAKRLGAIREKLVINREEALKEFREQFLDSFSPTERQFFETDPLLAIDRLYAGELATATLAALREPKTGKEAILQSGQWAWLYSYRLRPHDDAFAFQVTSAAAQLLLGMPMDLSLTVVTAASRWVDGAATTLSSSHKFFAALACTKIAHDSFEDIHIPWPAFLVAVPPGILVRPSDGIDFRFVFFYVLRDVNTGHGRQTACAMCLLSDGDGDARQVLRNFCTRDDPGEALRHVLFDDYEKDEDALSNEELRLMQSARRAVVGLLHTYQYTNNFKVGKTKGHEGMSREGPPPHRNIFFGTPLAYDCRPALAQYIREGVIVNPPSVQTLVRGHYKRQVIGELRKGRKVIWVEPYWRGPIDAPILSRPHHVG